MSDWVTRNVVLDKHSEQVVAERAKELGLGPKGFSAALRGIIRDWVAMQPKPVPTSSEAG